MLVGGNSIPGGSRMSKTYKIGNPNQQEKHPLSGQDRPASSCRKTGARASGEQTKAVSRSDEGPNRGRKGTLILDISADREIRPLTWEAAARKCIEAYREVFSKHKNCPRR